MRVAPHFRAPALGCPQCRISPLLCGRHGRPANPYLAEWISAGGDSFMVRTRLVQQYAWAVPNDAALDVLAGLQRPIIEIGAGTGYWASLLAEMGVDVTCYDHQPPSRGNNEYRHSTEWYPVQDGSFQVLAQYPEHVLFICWPPYNSTFALQQLRHYQGDTIVYVGEGFGGCTGDDRFHEQLGRYEVLAEVDIPCWDGIHDGLTVYHR